MPLSHRPRRDQLTAAIPRWRVLLALGAVSLIIYWVGLILPYNFSTLQLKPKLDIGQLTRGQPLAQAGFVLTLALLFGVYYLMWRVCRSQHTRSMWITLIGIAAAINLSMIWLYPIDATDIFDNIARGRITAQYGGNPFYETPHHHADDPAYAYVGWIDYTTAYGPLWEMVAAGTSRIVGNDILTNVIGFKIMNLLFYVGTIVLIARWLIRKAPDRALQGVYLFACNPLVIYETIGNGHNDIVMIFWIVLGLFALTYDRFVFAVLSIIAGALIKFIPILLLPIVFVVALRRLTTWRGRLLFAISSGFACAVLIAITTIPFWRGGDFLNLQARSVLFTSSLPSVVQAQLATSIGAEASQQTANRIAFLIIGLVVIVQTWRAWHATDWLVPIRSALIILLGSLLFSSAWFQPWYATWGLALAAILPEGATARTAVLLSFAVFGKTIFLNDFIDRIQPLPPRAVREALTALATFGLVWLYAGYAVLRRWVNSPLKGQL